MGEKQKFTDLGIWRGCVKPRLHLDFGDVARLQFGGTIKQIYAQTSTTSHHSIFSNYLRYL